MTGGQGLHHGAARLDRGRAILRRRRRRSSPKRARPRRQERFACRRDRARDPRGLRQALPPVPPGGGGRASACSSAPPGASCARSRASASRCTTGASRRRSPSCSERFPEAERDESLWPAIKLAYIGLLHEHRQPECAETFYNSVACQVLHRRYYHNEFIFWRPAVATEHLEGEAPTLPLLLPAAARAASRRCAKSPPAST